MNNSHENTALSFERILFFSDAVFAISRRSWAVPIVCAASIGLSFIAIAFGGFVFPFIPLVANLLYRKKKEILV